MVNLNVGRILCHISDLKKGLVKFPLNNNGLEGFAFMSTPTTAMGFVNQCPHLNLALDLNDSDFFQNGFIRCKAHGALFHPKTGVCIQPPLRCKNLRPLQRLNLTNVGGDIYLDRVSTHTDLKLDAWALNSIKPQNDLIKKELDTLNQRRKAFVEKSRRNKRK